MGAGAVRGDRVWLTALQAPHLIRLLRRSGPNRAVRLVEPCHLGAKLRHSRRAHLGLAPRFSLETPPLRLGARQSREELTVVRLLGLGRDMLAHEAEGAPHFELRVLRLESGVVSDVSVTWERRGSDVAVTWQ